MQYVQVLYFVCSYPGQQTDQPGKQLAGRYSGNHLPKYGSLTNKSGHSAVATSFMQGLSRPQWIELDGGVPTCLRIQTIFVNKHSGAYCKTIAPFLLVGSGIPMRGHHHPSHTSYMCDYELDKFHAVHLRRSKPTLILISKFITLPIVHNSEPLSITRGFMATPQYHLFAHLKNDQTTQIVGMFAYPFVTCGLTQWRWPRRKLLSTPSDSCIFTSCSLLVSCTRRGAPQEKSLEIFLFGKVWRHRRDTGRSLTTGLSIWGVSPWMMPTSLLEWLWHGWVCKRWCVDPQALLEKLLSPCCFRTFGSIELGGSSLDKGQAAKHPDEVGDICYLRKHDDPPSNPDSKMAIFVRGIPLLFKDADWAYSSDGEWFITGEQLVIDDG